MKIWYTQPEEGFSSFYYYDNDSLELVRVRLELGRDEGEMDPGDTGAFYRSNRHVCFSKFLFTTRECERFKPSGGKVTDDRGYRLKDKHKVGNYVYDFSWDRKTGSNAGAHRGNSVIDEGAANLPPGITKGQLEKLARICLRKKEDIVLTKADATEAELAEAIKKAIETGQSNTEEDAYETVVLGEDAAVRHRRGCRCCRCTIV